ncbi:two-component system response regulator [Zobellella taiwanensis]|uniref:Two-component system response regulator n=1 Tax=Zobellella taiwanensis TaxID=347535 RepID=A0A2P7R4D2_9GAMM|nr:response regulator [Zobellella taiwanensis]PSJ45083.1 two-component system response regulator [Zobellella taiwanensis]
MRHFLLVDDNATFATLLGRSFARRQLALSWAETGERALACHPAPEGIILDLNLGEESGLQLLPALCRRFPGVPVLVLTGYASISTAVTAVKLGATQYLPKPADVDTILAAFEAPDIPVAPPPEELVAFRPSVRKQSWEYVQFVLQQHEGNISAAARALGMHRRTLQRMLQKKPAPR